MAYSEQQDRLEAFLQDPKTQGEVGLECADLLRKARQADAHKHGIWKSDPFGLTESSREALQTLFDQVRYAFKQLSYPTTIWHYFAMRRFDQGGSLEEAQRCLPNEGVTQDNFAQLIEKHVEPDECRRISEEFQLAKQVCMAVREHLRGKIANIPASES